MSTKLKLSIISKVLPSANKDILNYYVKNMQVVSAAQDNNIFIDLENTNTKSKNTNSENDMKLHNESLNKKRFFIERDFFIRSVVNDIINPTTENNEPKNIVMDFSSPNIAKPFHVGHLRSTIIGNFIANINKYYQNKVTKINYLGDWGTQFGYLQYGLKIKNLDISNSKDAIKELFEVYVHANKLAAADENVHKDAVKYFSDIEQGKEDLTNWKKVREVTVSEIAKIYDRLDIKFDEFHWESDYNGNAIKNIINMLEEKQILKTDENGKKVAKFRDKDITVVKSDNSTLYLSRDIAAALDRYHRYNFDEMLYVVDNSQSDHFAAVFDIVSRVDEQCGHRCKHIKFGRIKGMKTRTGNVVFLNDILDEAKNKMLEKQMHSKNTRLSAMDDKTCDILGATAVIINDLKQKRQKDYIFEWEKALQSEGDSGIKLQYLHCRLSSLEENCGVALPTNFTAKLIPERVVTDVILDLAKFEYVLLRAKNENEACILVSYLFKLSKNVNRMFNELNVKNEEQHVAAERLLVFHSARLVLNKALRILGVNPLHKM